MQGDQGTVSRRAVLAGLGAVGGGTLVVGGFGPTAGADPGPAGPAVTQGVPAGVTTIASPPVEGVSYRFLSMWDFNPLSGVRKHSGNGGFYSDPAGELWASMDLLPGMVLRDIEWYARNASPASGLGRIWRAGSTYADVAALDVPIAAGTTAHATRADVPAASNGPYPHGCKLTLGIVTDNINVINGVRVGFSPGTATTALLPTPIRVYDSRTSGGSLAAGASRFVTLASAVPAGAIGALVNLSITSTQGTGTLRVGSSSSTPVATAIQWARTGDKVTALVATKVSLGRNIAVQSASSTGATHFIVDVIGYLV